MSTMPPPSPVPAVTPPPPKPTGIDWLKELVIAVVAFIILVALLMTYEKLGRMPAVNVDPIPEYIRVQMANLEKVGTALFAIFGAIIGYYCGRVPAERSASAAQQAANAERNVADREKDTARRATALLAQARDRVAVRASGVGDAVNDPFLRDLDTFLRQRGPS